MIKKDHLKSLFEAVVELHHSRGWVSTSSGRKPLFSIAIEIEHTSTDKYCISLVTYVNKFYGVIQARSYPMSYKSAYRLVCSL